MTSETRCEKTDLLERDCAHCRGHHDPDLYSETNGDTEHPARTMTARYTSTCRCGASIVEGQTIFLTSAGWVCGECEP